MTAPYLEMPLGRFLLQSLWIAARLILVYYLGNSGALFFYQNF
ncbi:hypothetical protein [Singulisphaera sp. PoT]